uniref:hypothetical protein n=1 Tax=Paractinoplanes polyasparticus TaxID=2856853 RepID=UPI001C85D6C0|nr:hypothetical protein [Actinoplanes polyasparticus]
MDRASDISRTAVCVVTMRVERGRLLISVLINPDVRNRTQERRLVAADPDDTCRMIRDTAEVLLQDSAR